jgi:signal peptidase II
MSEPPARGPSPDGTLPDSPTGRLLRYRLFWLLALGILAVDQVTKFWIQQALPPGSYGPGGWIPVVPGFLYWVHVHNTGAAWGLFRDGALFLAGLAAVVLALLYRFRHALELRHPYNQWVFGLIVGGILGNFVDRVLYGHVVDFIDVHLPVIDYRWPAFNVADSGICIGVLLYAIAAFFPEQVLGTGRPSADAHDRKNGPADQDQAQ